MSAAAASSEPGPGEELLLGAVVTRTRAVSAAIFERRSDGGIHALALAGLFPPLVPIEAEPGSSRARKLARALKPEPGRVGEGVIGTVAVTGQAELLEDARQDPRVPLADDEALVIQSMIVLPLPGDRVLAVANTVDGQPFRESDLATLQALVADWASRS